MPGAHFHADDVDRKQGSLHAGSTRRRSRGLVADAATALRPEKTAETQEPTFVLTFVDRLECNKHRLSERGPRGAEPLSPIDRPRSESDLEAAGLKTPQPGSAAHQ